MIIMNFFKIVAISFFLPIALFPGKLPNFNDVNGVWFSEINQEKSIYIFAEAGNGAAIPLIILNDKGGFRSIACNEETEQDVKENDAKSCAFYFPDKGIMIFKSPSSPYPVVLKQVLEPQLIREVNTLVIQRRSELLLPIAAGADRRTLAAEIKGSISWDLLHMSVGEFLGWLAKQEKMEVEKKMRKAGQEMKFPARHHEDINGLAKIKGSWQFNKRRIFVFSDSPAGEAMGVKLYHMEMVNRPGYEGYEPAYTILVHEEDQRSYLHIVFWQFEFQAPIRIEFPDPDKLVTYQKGMLDAEAIRIKE
jgi:hypothetical protein